MPTKAPIHRPAHAPPPAVTPQTAVRTGVHDAAPRASACERGYDRRWQKYRLWFLARNPLCAHCLEQKRVTPATVVDHIIPHQGPDDPLFWLASNHQGLCASHHSIKTASEDGAFGNAKKQHGQTRTQTNADSDPQGTRQQAG